MDKERHRHRVAVGMRSIDLVKGSILTNAGVNSRLGLDGILTWVLSLANEAMVRS